MTVLSFPIIGGALVEVPLYEKHKRGRNWMAKVQPNANAPGGWDREFAQTGRGEDMKYIVADVFPGNVLEFGADYVTSTGKKSANRKYAVVVTVNDKELSAVLFDKAIDAWQARDAIACLPVELKAPTVAPATKVEEAVALLESLSDEERLAVLDAFCGGCGCKQPDVGPACQCRNDE